VQLKRTANQLFNPNTKDMKCVAWSPDGKYFATGTDDGHLLLWDRDGKIHYDFQKPTRFNDVTFIPIAERSTTMFIAAANEDGEIYVLNLKPGSVGGAK
jgi:WD40 repeat protein